MTTREAAIRWSILDEERKTIEAEMTTLAEQLAAELDHPDEGSKTHNLDGVKVTVTARVNRTINGDTWYAIRNGIPKTMWPVREKLSADARGCRYLAEKEPKLWAVAAAAITERRGKPGIKVEASNA